MFKKPEIRTLKYIAIYELVPKEWNWLWDEIDADSNDKFILGNNALPIVTPAFFADYCRDRIQSVLDSDIKLPISKKEINEWLDFIRNLGVDDPVYIVME
jgi:hypothetical protein